MNKRKLLAKLLQRPNNIPFGEFVAIIEAFGFGLERVKGNHHIYKRKGISAMINVQNVNGKAKPYQIKQFFSIVEKNDLRLEDE